MKELMTEKEMKSIKGKTEPLAKFPPYTSEMYINDILEIFYVKNSYNEIEIFDKFKIIDSRSMREDSNIDFINKIKPYNLNIIERLILIKIAISQMQGKSYNLSKRDIISKLFDLKIDKPLNILNMFSTNSKLVKNKCIENPEEDYHYKSLSINDDLFFALFNLKEEKQKLDNNEFEKETTININPNEIYTKLNSYVIGQETATKNIVAGIYEHIIKCKINQDKNKKDKLDKTNTLIIGPTGTGKTFICNTLSKLLDIPIYIADASQFTESGYIGLSVDTTITSLAKKCRGKMLKDNKFPVSIIYIDEIDKIAILKENEREAVHQRGVQEELLKLIESERYLCDGDRRFGDGDGYDISNVMFILGGAFSGLDKIIETRLNKNKDKKIGFCCNANSSKNELNLMQQMKTEDLVEYGFIPELLGRLTNRAILKPLTKQDLINILTTGKNNVIEQYKEIFLHAGIKLNILDEAIETIAQKALDNNTGARGLKNTLSNILNKVLFDASIDKRNEYTLTSEIFC